MVPVLWEYIALGTNDEAANRIALILAVTMVLTDFFDGFFARLLKQTSPLGQFLDPVADKISILAGMLALVVYRDYPEWLFIIILVREIIGTAGSLYLIYGHRVLGKPNWWGKTGVALISLSGLAYLMQWEWKVYTTYPIVVVLVIGLTAYFFTYRRHFA